MLALLAALGLLVGGETVLKDRLGGATFLLYWGVCFLLTGLAMILAFRDLRAVQRRTREEQRELLQEALKGIEAEARSRGRGGGGRFRT